MNKSNLLDARILRIGNTLVASHIGLRDKDILHLGLLTYSPFYGKYSPGILIVKLICQKLVKQGVKILDLSPGGDAYKARFANMYDIAHTLVIYSSGSNAIIKKFIIFVRKVINKVTKQQVLYSIVETKLYKFIKWLRRQKSTKLLKKIFSIRVKICIYRYNLKKHQESQFVKLLAKDNLADLMKFKENDSLVSQKSFLLKCLNKIESGGHFYTYTQNEKLLFCGWLFGSSSKILIEEIQQYFLVPESCMFLYDCYAHPQFREGIPYDQIIHELLLESRLIQPANSVFASVSCKDVQFSRAIEQIGFTRDYSLNF
jgi:hypothetical protein